MYIAICDDDTAQINDLKNKCKNARCFSETTLPVTIQTYRYGQDLLIALKTDPKLQYDIIFLDIEFGPNTLNGIETAKALREMGIEAPIIISTSYDAYLRQGYGLGIMRYIDKPVSQEDIDEALSACVKKIVLLGGKEIILKNGTESVAVKYRDIIYFESIKHVIYAHIKNQQKYTCSITVLELEQQIPKQFFLRIHKGLLVNFDYVTCIKGFNLTLDDGTILPIAQRRRSDCIEFFRDHVKENL